MFVVSHLPLSLSPHPPTYLVKVNIPPSSSMKWQKEWAPLWRWWISSYISVNVSSIYSNKNILGIMISSISSLKVHGVNIKAIKYVLKINLDLDLQYVALLQALNSTPMTILIVGSS